MLLQDIFSVSRIKAGLEAEDKDEAFEELVDVLARSYTLADREGILAAVQEREAKMSTGIKNGIGIPHGKAGCVTGIYGALGISAKGIDYDALDGEPVYLIIMVVSSPDDAELHLQTLKRIAMLLEHPEFYEEIKKAATPEAAHTILKHYEDIIIAQE